MFIYLSKKVGARSAVGRGGPSPLLGVVGFHLLHWRVCVSWFHGAIGATAARCPAGGVDNRQLPCFSSPMPASQQPHVSLRCCGFSFFLFILLRDAVFVPLVLDLGRCVCAVRLPSPTTSG